MRRYAFLRTRRWVGVALIAVLVAVVCVFLGRWQWDRHETRAAANDLISANYDLPVEPLEAVAPDAVAADDVWRRVAVTGTYEGEQLVVRNRPVDGVPAGRVLAVLRTDDDGAAAATSHDDSAGAATSNDDGGRLVVVDRGWFPLGEADPVPPPYPDGEVSLVARLRQAEAADSRTPPAGQVYRIYPASVVELAGTGDDGAALIDGYLLAVAEDTAPAEALSPFPRPEITPGAHLSYAFQWWVFAVGALVGFVVLARREAAEITPVDPAAVPPGDGGATAADGPQAVPTASPARRSRRRSDAEEEDALIDAQLHDS